jgi:hypothetical protein
MAQVNWLRWSALRTDGERTGGACSEYRCDPCAVTWWQENDTELMTPEQHAAWRTAKLTKIPTATALPPRKK